MTDLLRNIHMDEFKTNIKTIVDDIIYSMDNLIKLMGDIDREKISSKLYNLKVSYYNSLLNKTLSDSSSPSTFLEHEEKCELSYKTTKDNIEEIYKKK